jgi:hypothetical protein
VTALPANTSRTPCAVARPPIAPPAWCHLPPNGLSKAIGGVEPEVETLKECHIGTGATVAQVPEPRPRVSSTYRSHCGKYGPDQHKSMYRDHTAPLCVFVSNLCPTAKMNSSRERENPRICRGFSNSGGRIRTCDLRVMSPTSYRTAPPRAAWRNHYSTLQHRRPATHVELPRRCGAYPQTVAVPERSRAAHRQAPSLVPWSPRSRHTTMGRLPRMTASTEREERKSNRRSDKGPVRCRGHRCAAAHVPPLACRHL